MDENNELNKEEQSLNDKESKEKEEEEKKNININNNNNEPEEERIVLSSKIIWIMFSFIVGTMLLGSVDGGVIPASNNQMMKEMDINESQYGLFSTFGTLGGLLGALVVATIIGKYNRKYLTAGSLFLLSLSLYIPILTTSYIPNLLIRGFSGLGSAFLNIYMNIWCDQFGLPKNRTMMITMIALGSPVGTLAGFGLQTLIGNWKVCFAINATLMVGLGICFLLCPELYFSNTLKLVKGTDNYEAIKNFIKLEQIKETSVKKSLIKLGNNLKKILCEGVFLFTTLGESVSIFAINIVQYWCTNYMQHVLGVDDEKQLFILFSFMCATGPPLGFLSGGITGTMIGGYAKKGAIVLVVIYSLVAGIIGGFSIFANSGWTYAISMWLYLMFVCATVPLQVGIVINSLSQELKGDGNAIFKFLSSLIGSLPSAYIYGKIDENTSYKRLAMLVTLSYMFIGFLWNIVALGFRFRVEDEEESEKLKVDIYENNNDEGIKENEE